MLLAVSSQETPIKAGEPSNDFTVAKPATLADKETQAEAGVPVAPYVSSRLLDRPPEVLVDLSEDLPSLPFFEQGGRSVLTLYVGEDGTVKSIDEEESDLPPTIAAEVKHSFLEVRFRPGTIGGKPTRFAMRIEVAIRPAIAEE